QGRARRLRRGPARDAGPRGHRRVDRLPRPYRHRSDRGPGRTLAPPDAARRGGPDRNRRPRPASWTYCLPETAGVAHSAGVVVAVAAARLAAAPFALSRQQSTLTPQVAGRRAEGLAFKAQGLQV